MDIWQVDVGKRLRVYAIHSGDPNVEPLCSADRAKSLLLKRREADEAVTISVHSLASLGKMSLFKLPLAKPSRSNVTYRKPISAKLLIN